MASPLSRRVLSIFLISALGAVARADELDDALKNIGPSTKVGSTEAQAEEKAREGGSTATRPGDPLREIRRRQESGAEESLSGPPSNQRTPSAPGAAPAPEARSLENAAQTQNSERRAMGSAKRITGSLERLGHSADDAPIGGPDGAGGGPRSAPNAGATASASGKGAQQAPTYGATPEAQLALAELGGFRASFEHLGLKVVYDAAGRGRVTDGRGVAATPAQLGQLQEQLARDPAALERFPNFFTIIPRERFEELRQTYALSGGVPGIARAFTDVDATPKARDFIWSRSCSPVATGCNPASQRRSYRRGDYVPPDDLSRIWAATHATSPAADDEQLVSLQAPTRHENIGGRIRGFLDAVGEALFTEAPRSTTSGGAYATPEGVELASVISAPVSDRASAIAMTAPQQRRSLQTPAPAPGQRAPRRPTNLFWALAAGAVLVMAALYLFRRNPPCATPSSPD